VQSAAREIVETVNRSDSRFVDRERPLKGLPGEWRLYAVA